MALLPRLLENPLPPCCHQNIFQEGRRLNSHPRCLSLALGLLLASAPDSRNPAARRLQEHRASTAVEIRLPEHKPTFTQRCCTLTTKRWLLPSNYLLVSNQCLPLAEVNWKPARWVWAMQFAGFQPLQRRSGRAGMERRAYRHSQHRVRLRHRCFTHSAAVCGYLQMFSIRVCLKQREHMLHVSKLLIEHYQNTF